ncbi:MAG: hypothetical protein IH589_19790 [Anaerolineales bacterium]|nr:hypothetical protein [Anaerolineales bacterium]
MKTPSLEDQLVSELWARDVRFILGSKPDHPPTLSPANLIMALSESHEARLQLSLIPLFLRHPEFAVHTNAIANKTNSTSQLILKCFYSAAVWLEQKHLSRKVLPDLFSEELGLTPSSNPEENLRMLAKRQRELSGSQINWLGTYQHAANIWLKELELQQG